MSEVEAPWGLGDDWLDKMWERVDRNVFANTLAVNGEEYYQGFAHSRSPRFGVLSSDCRIAPASLPLGAWASGTPPTVMSIDPVPENDKVTLDSPRWPLLPETSPWS